MPRTENGIDTEIIAESAWQAHRAARGLPRIAWDQASDEEEARWQRLATKIEELLLTLQGSNYNQIALAVARSWHRTDESLQLPHEEFLAWEAVSRHLAMLVDADEIPDDLEKTERSWDKWVKDRLKTINVALAATAGEK